MAEAGHGGLRETTGLPTWGDHSGEEEPAVTVGLARDVVVDYEDGGDIGDVESVDGGTTGVNHLVNKHLDKVHHGQESMCDSLNKSEADSLSQVRIPGFPL